MHSFKRMNGYFDACKIIYCSTHGIELVGNVCKFYLRTAVDGYYLRTVVDGYYLWTAVCENYLRTVVCGYYLRTTVRGYYLRTVVRGYYPWITIIYGLYFLGKLPTPTLHTNFFS